MLRLIQAMGVGRCAASFGACTVRYMSGDVEDALREWKRSVDSRDELVRSAHTAGVSINRIHVLTGIGRSTIYRILDADGADRAV